MNKMNSQQLHLQHKQSPVFATRKKRWRIYPR